MSDARYTMAQVDAALRAMAPEYQGWKRTISIPGLIRHCAIHAWVDQRPEDHHTAVLRSALRDLERTGALRPHDGV